MKRGFVVQREQNPTFPPDYPERSLAESALDLLFPPTCVGCRRVGRWVCVSCWQEISWLLERRCGVCGANVAVTHACEHKGSLSTPVDGICVVAQFDGVAREAVHALKYEGRHAISGLLGSLLSLTATDTGADLVLGVPLHPRRRRERGYDQALMLAKALARRLAIPFDSGALVRTRYTTQQVTLSANDRRSNVKGAFKVRGDVTGRTILLVDDVWTTGATMKEAAGVLRDAGAERIIAAVFARALESGGTSSGGAENRPPRSLH